jgi:hypothetical protein
MRAVLRRLIVLAVASAASILCLAHKAHAAPISGLDYDWVVRLDDSDNGTDDLELTLTAEGDWYVGFGVSSFGMSGPIVTCYLPGGASEAVCSDWDANFRDIGTRTNRSTVVSTNSSGSSYTVVVRMPAESMNIVPGSEQRIIFARGPYDADLDEPRQHATDGFGADAVDFYSQNTSDINETDETDEPELPPPPETTAAPVFDPIMQLNGKIEYDWAVLVGASAPHEFELSLTAHGDWYVGFGVAAEGMHGPFVTCYAPSESLEAVCSDWTGIGRSLGTRQNRSTVVRTVRSGSSYTVVVRMSAESMGIVQGTDQRVIFAHGTYDTIENKPEKHQFGARGSDSEEFYTRTRVASLDFESLVL